jgi:ABC-2 type transport system permease protein
LQPAEARSGSIYDLGYRNYDGVRLGRAHTIFSLYLYTLRGAFGFGRRTSSKIIPIVIAVIAFIPAAGQLAIASVLTTQIDVYTPSNYFAYIEVPVALFCAAIAPEISGRDQRQHTLSLYFSRALFRRDYAFAKLAAFASALLVLTLVPQAVLVIGNGLTTDDLWGYITDNWADLPRTLVTGLSIAVMAASVSLAMASQTPRRAWAAIGVFAWFLITFIVSGVLTVEVGGLGRYAVFFAPFQFIHGFTLWVFNKSPEVGSPLDHANFPFWVYPVTVLSYATAGVAIVIRRFDRIPA